MKKLYIVINYFSIQSSLIPIEMHATIKPFKGAPHQCTPSQPQDRPYAHILNQIAINGPIKRNAIIAAGEGRSANRNKWTSSSQAAVLDGDPSGVAQLSQPDIPSQRDASSLVWECAEAVRPEFAAIDMLVHSNIARVQNAFHAARVGPHHFSGSTGYGHGDLGREALDDVMAGIMGAESAAVRIQYVSGTHAIASALYGCLRPGDELLAVAGSPYDTLEEVIGIRGTLGSGSLAEFGVSYRKLDLSPNGAIDWVALATAIKSGTLRL